MVLHDVSQCNGIALRIVSASIHYDEINFAEFAAVFWTIVQFSFIAVMTIAFVYTQRLTLFIILIMGYAASGINEWGLKHITDEKRPEGHDGSCIPTNGFPSGHAVVSLSYWSWIMLECAFRPSWTWRKRVAIAFFMSGILLPVGPMRSVLHDHSWKQIGAGMGIGVAWGTLVWLFCRFVITPNLYHIMGWKIVQFFHIRNDLRPYFEQSKFEGKKIDKHSYNLKFYKYLDTKRWRRTNYRDPFLIDVFHGVIIGVGLFLGALAIVLGFIKRHRDQSSCDVFAPDLMFSAGTLTFATILFFIPVAVMLHRKLRSKEWHPEVVQCFMFVVGFFFCQTSFFAWCVKYGTLDGVRGNHQKCQGEGVDLGIVYVVMYFVIVGLMVLIASLCYFILDLRRLYGFKSRKPSQVEEINKGSTIEEALKTFDDKSTATSTVSSPSPLTPSTSSPTSVTPQTDLRTPNA